MDLGLKQKLLIAAAVVLPTLVEDKELASVELYRSGTDIEIEIRFTEERRAFCLAFPCSGHTDLGYIVSHLFSELQDSVVESAFAWGENRPPCPGHQHPRRLIRVDSELRWECPVNNSYRKERAFPQLSYVERPS